MPRTRNSVFQQTEVHNILAKHVNSRGNDCFSHPVGADLRVRPEMDLRVRPENGPASPENVRTCGVGRMIGQTQAHGQTYGDMIGQTHRSAPTGERASAENIRGEHTGSPLHRVVQWFKTMATNEYIRGVKQYGWPPFPGKLWQRNYWEHIVRDESELNRIREYICNNPAHWEMDSLFISTSCPERVAVRPYEAHEARAGYAIEEWMVKKSKISTNPYK